MDSASQHTVSPLWLCSFLLSVQYILCRCKQMHQSCSAFSLSPLKTPIGGLMWCHSGPNSYWKIQMTSEEVLLVLADIKILRHDVWDTFPVSCCKGVHQSFVRWRKAAFFIWLFCIWRKRSLFFLPVVDSIIISGHPVWLFVAKELQVEADPHFPRRDLVQQETTCHRSLVFKLLLYGCHGNLCSTQKVWYMRRNTETCFKGIIINIFREREKERENSLF